MENEEYMNRKQQEAERQRLVCSSSSSPSLSDKHKMPIELLTCSSMVYMTFRIAHHR